MLFSARQRLLIPNSDPSALLPSSLSFRWFLSSLVRRSDISFVSVHLHFLLQSFLSHPVLVPSCFLLVDGASACFCNTSFHLDTFSMAAPPVRQWGVTPPISTVLPTPDELAANDDLITELKVQNNFESPAETERR